jgi:hypothetical protein
MLWQASREALLQEFKRAAAVGMCFHAAAAGSFVSSRLAQAAKPPLKDLQALEQMLKDYNGPVALPCRRKQISALDLDLVKPAAGHTKQAVCNGGVTFAQQHMSIAAIKAATRMTACAHLVPGACTRGGSPVHPRLRAC